MCLYMNQTVELVMHDQLEEGKGDSPTVTNNQHIQQRCGYNRGAIQWSKQR